jgi:hypothetical protein
MISSLESEVVDVLDESHHVLHLQLGLLPEGLETLVDGGVVGFEFLVVDEVQSLGAD